MSQPLKIQKFYGPMALNDVMRLREAIVNWFAEAGKDYPWRSTHDPYEILVSEIMLQQTQVSTVLGRGYYRRWLDLFPNIFALYEASEEEVLRAWEGLGYYSRARNLHKAASVVVKEFGGIFPTDLSQIESLPGVGRYTAGAIASFSFNAAVPVVDANIARVLARLFEFKERIDTGAGKKQLWEWAAALVPESGARKWNSALMELGQTLCRSKSVECEKCPAATWCLTRDPLELPVKKARAKLTLVNEHVLLSRRGSRILLKKETGRRRKGMWKLPDREAREIDGLRLLVVQKYGITRYKVMMHVYELEEVKARENEQWFDLNQIDHLPVSSPYRRVIERSLE